MKKYLLFLLLFDAALFSCNNSGKDSVEKADSANKATQDTALINKKIVVDEVSAAFLVRVANENLAEMEMSSIAQQKAVYQGVKDYAGSLLLANSSLDSQVLKLGFEKNIVLPQSISDEKKNEINSFQKKTGKNVDKEFIERLIKNHTDNINMFQKALQELKDPEINSLADKALPLLRVQLDSAIALQKKYW